MTDKNHFSPLFVSSSAARTSSSSRCEPQVHFFVEEIEVRKGIEEGKNDSLKQPVIAAVTYNSYSCYLEDPLAVQLALPPVGTGTDSDSTFTSISICICARITEFLAITSVTSDKACEKTRAFCLNFPMKFALFISVVNIAIFIEGAKGKEIGLHKPVSPYDSMRLWMFSVNPTTCKDERSEYYRLFTGSLVHQGLMHLLGNVLGLLIFGYVAETRLRQGFFSSAFIYFVGVVSGSLGFNFNNPYRALIGCSSGVYSLIGSTFGVILMDYDTCENYYSVLGVLAVQLMGDLFMFIFNYDSNIGYSAHIFGFIAGLSLTLIFYYWKKCGWKKVFSAVGAGTLTCLFLVLINTYCTNFPPRRKNDDNSCCELLYAKASNLRMGIETVMNLYICVFNNSNNSNELVPYNNARVRENLYIELGNNQLLAVSH